MRYIGVVPERDGVIIEVDGEEWRWLLELSNAREGEGLDDPETAYSEGGRQRRALLRALAGAVRRISPASLFWDETHYAAYAAKIMAEMTKESLPLWSMR
jgi:hypothetical protein